MDGQRPAALRWVVWILVIAVSAAVIQVAASWSGQAWAREDAPALLIFIAFLTAPTRKGRPPSSSTRPGR
ncbi:hypothetical protein [Micromonospora mirobrigensis]|nr:hypothetical protein [Micromonospora mirobrigensis]